MSNAMVTDASFPVLFTFMTIGLSSTVCSDPKLCLYFLDIFTVSMIFLAVTLLAAGRASKL